MDNKSKTKVQLKDNCNKLQSGFRDDMIQSDPASID